MRCMWDFQTHRRYKVVCNLIIGYAAFFSIGILILASLKGEGFDFFNAHLVPLILTTITAQGIARCHKPPWAKHNHVFDNTVFNRRYLDIFQMTNDQFAGRLQHALYVASAGDDLSLLDKLVHSISDDCLEDDEDDRKKGHNRKLIRWNSPEMLPHM